MKLVDNLSCIFVKLCGIIIILMSILFTPFQFLYCKAPFETASLIYERDKLKHIPIIFITAHQYGEDFLFKGYELGGVDYIYKPIWEQTPSMIPFQARAWRLNLPKVMNTKL